MMKLTADKIKEIIKEGTVLEKTLLYLEDVAFFNTEGYKSLYFADDWEPGLSVTAKELLTQKERDILLSSIKSKADIKRYEDMRIYNSSFLLFKDKLSEKVALLGGVYELIKETINTEEDRVIWGEVIKELIKIYPDDKSKEKAMEILHKQKGKKIGIIFIDNEYIDIQKNNYWSNLEVIIERGMEAGETAKLYLFMFKLILKKKLPLQGYREWVKAKEKEVKELLNRISKLLDREDKPVNFPAIKKWEDIETEITKEDVEEFKKAGG